MINFILGLIIGGLIGMVLMCLLQINRDNKAQRRINKVIKYIKNIKPLSLEETALKESIKQAYYESYYIKNCKESFDMVCHLEDFEIAMWSILEILGGDVDE